MPSLPFPVSGTAYESNGSTTIASLRVICRNVTNNETITYTTNSSGQFIFDLSNFTSGYSTGDEISLFASYGNYYREVVFTVSGQYKEQNLTLNVEIESYALYCTVAEVRQFSGVDSSEFSDTAVYNMIQRVTARIDELTGRTWKGTQTETDEYYDGDDTDMLWLNHTDIQSVTSLSIDDNSDGTYTSITSTYVHVYEQGYIVLDRDAEITTFTGGPKTVKITYTYGNSMPSQSVKEMAILMVANLLHYDPVREDMINRIFQRVRWSGPKGLA
jgi:hypothetical protein